VPSLVGARRGIMAIRITALKRLLFATSELGTSTHPMEQQIGRTIERLNRGVDLNGNSFAPYEYKNVKHLHSRPLERAARLFESPRYDITSNANGMELKATITGQAAKIATYQNIKRRFVGFSRTDRPEIREELKSKLGEAFRRWR
jgi:hypothetical protein